MNKEPMPELEFVTEDDLSEVMVRQLCGELPDNEKDLFWLRYMEGYNSSELGKLYDLPASTVRARLLSARKKITKLYYNQKGNGE
jgi:RNA polymerase sigma-70 factor (ECF subfamily)